VDGNKRIAFASMDVFLRLNGYKLNRVSEQLFADIMGMLEAGELNLAKVDAWLRGFVHRDPP
jgi:death-on-curing protein